MRTTLDIDERLMNAALKASGLKTKKDVVAEGLRLLVRLNRQKRIKSRRGKLAREGDLDRSRRCAP